MGERLLSLVQMQGVSKVRKVVKEFLRDAAHIRHTLLVLATTHPANLPALPARLETHREIVDGFYGPKDK